MAVDTMGNLLSVMVHSAGIQDRAGARSVLVRLHCAFSTIQTVFVDGGCSGALIEWTLAMFKRDTTTKIGVKSKRLKAGWDNDYLLYILQL